MTEIDEMMLRYQALEDSYLDKINKLPMVSQAFEPDRDTGEQMEMYDYMLKKEIGGIMKKKKMTDAELETIPEDKIMIVGDWHHESSEEVCVYLFLDNI